MYERLEAIVSGKVQMVMYRDFAQRKAHRLKLVGEVRNLRDGTVEVIAEGPRDTLETYLKKLHSGPVLARVDSITHSFIAATGFYTDFQISYQERN